MTWTKHVKNFKALSMKLPWRLGGGEILRESLENAQFFFFVSLFNYCTPLQWHQMMDGFIKGLV